MYFFFIIKCSTKLGGGCKVKEQQKQSFFRDDNTHTNKNLKLNNLIKVETERILRSLQALELTR